MNKKIFAIGILAAVVLPTLVLAQGTGIWEGTTCAATSETGGPNEACTFCDALVVIQNVIIYLTEIAATISVGMMIYGAFRMMIAGGSEGSVSAARQIIINALLGFVITVSAWVIINTILHFLSGGVDFPWNAIECIM